MKKIILASQSPRRREILEKCGISFTVEPADLDESINDSRPLQEEIMRLAERKAESVLQRHPDAVVIGSDTVVTIDHRVLGKPKDKQQAHDMLKSLQGRTHQVITGLAILSREHTFTDVSISDVTFCRMSDEEIDRYISCGECMDKAGAYGIQGTAGRYITEIHGDYYSIMGLPLHIAYRELSKII